MAKLERIYTVPLGKAYETVRRKRAPRAIKILRAFISRHMKAEDERITVSGALNTLIWARSIQKPPRRVKVRLVKDEGFIRAYLADEKVEEIKPAKKDEKKETAKPEANKEAAPAKTETPKKAEPNKAPPYKEDKPRFEAKKEIR
jgi:large subunit ribosomal protein L31e